MSNTASDPIAQAAASKPQAKKADFVGGNAANTAAVLVNLVEAGVIKKDIFEGKICLRTFQSNRENGGLQLSIEKSIDYAGLKALARGGKSFISIDMYGKLNAVISALNGYTTTDEAALQTIITSKLEVTTWDGQFGQKMYSIYPKRERVAASLTVGGKPASVSAPAPAASADLKPEEAACEPAPSLEVENPFEA